MLALYHLPALHAEAAASVGVDDIERRQRVHQLSQKVLSGCRQASQPFCWIRACGLRCIAAALSAGLEDGSALAAVLEATYSQVLEVILSRLDRDLLPDAPPPPPLPPLPAGGGSAAAAEPLTQEQQQGLLAAVGRCPAGHALAAASGEEMREAFRVMQALVLLHPRSRALLASSQFLQLITARACEVPSCLPHAMPALLALLQGNEEAQAVFVTTGGLDMLLTRTLQHAAQEQWEQQQQQPGGRQAPDGGAAPPPDLLLRLLVFLQVLLAWGIGEAVRRGAHPSTQRSALSLVAQHLGKDATAALTQGLGQIVAAAGPAGPAGELPAGSAALGAAAAAGAPGGVVPVEDVLRQRARQAAALMEEEEEEGGWSASEGGGAAVQS